MASKSEDFEVGQSREGASRDRDSAPLARGNAVMIEAVLRAFIAEDYHEGRREAGRFALAALEEMVRHERSVDPNANATGACECPTRAALEKAIEYPNNCAATLARDYDWLVKLVRAFLDAPCPCAGMRERLPEIPCCPPHEAMWKAGTTKPLDNCFVCIRNERDELLAEREQLRASIRNQAGDNLCWLTDADLGKIPPKAEFLQSCERYHAQIAGERGELAGSKTIAQLEAECDRFRAELARFGTITPCKKCDGSGKDERGSACCRIPGHARDCGCLICQWKNACYRNENEGNQARFPLTASQERERVLREALKPIVDYAASLEDANWVPDACPVYACPIATNLALHNPRLTVGDLRRVATAQATPEGTLNQNTEGQ